MAMKRDREHFQGCLIGGAIGDSLGWPVEFMSYEAIIAIYGGPGITEPVCAPSGLAEITDDTQMTLFTAEGILRAEARSRTKGIGHPATVVYDAYQRWLATQGYPRVEEYDGIYDGYLFNVQELHAQRGPGNTCLSALSARVPGDRKRRINNSKGCGGVMRVAPAGLFYRKEAAFEMGADFAALTHGHPSGYLSAGALAYIIAAVIEGEEIEPAVRGAIKLLETCEEHEECTRALNLALALQGEDLPAVDAVRRLGEGWVGEEALAIAVYCALKYSSDFKQALIAAVNHVGDSDSTGAITGSILGAYRGLSAIPQRWIDNLELKAVIMQVADDLLTGYEESAQWWERYPGC